MKRIFVCLLFVFLILPVIAFAEAEIAEAVAEVVVAELPTEPVSWDQLATISGAALATLLIVQLLKLPLDKVWKIPTRIVVFFIAFMVVTNKYINAGRMYRLNERLSSTADGVRLLEIAEYKELYEALLAAPVEDMAEEVQEEAEA